MWTSLSVLLIGAVMIAAAAFWVLRAYHRAGGGARSPLPALAACGAVALMTLGAYLAVGRPELADAPYEARLAALKQRDPTSFTVDEALAVLNEAARAHPADPLPHLYAGQLLLDQGRAQEAARSFDSALRREPQLAEALLGMGRATVQIEQGRVSPEALAFFQQASQFTNDPAPWIYQALAAMESGREEDARRLWGEALTRMSPDDPRRAMAQRLSAER